MKKDYKKLELDKILDLLSQNAYCDVCRERIKKIKPSFDIDTVRTEITKTVSYTHLSIAVFIISAEITVTQVIISNMNCSFVKL